MHGVHSNKAIPAPIRLNSLIVDILKFLGFTAISGAVAAVRGEPKGNEALYARVAMDAGEQARPIPQFGSQAQGNYDLVCFWEGRTSEPLAVRLKALRIPTRTLFLLYLGRLSPRLRNDLLNQSRSTGSVTVILDETLLLFLASLPNHRLTAFFHCALPFTLCNPYTPFQAGDVPEEMFFGREEMANELMRPSGSCLVYGGRQLGKSALLRHVQRRFHQQGRQHYAWVSDIKSVGDPLSGQPSEIIWRKLLDCFLQMGLIDKSKRTAGSSEAISRHIREAMAHTDSPSRSPQRHVLIMFDEADNFLDADDKSNFEIVTALRGLMQDTGRRFKVVFAGLHIVQRFQFRANQPLAHFGAPILVGPLEPEAAQKLIRDPFEALGFRFADEAAVLRILSYTNYHPGLIQLFCQELLKQLQERANYGTPPYHITQSDVEAVYRLREVRNHITERFNWTLALDPHYQAIAWAVIDKQIKPRDSYAEAFTPGEILQMARNHWPEGFRDVDSNSLRGLLTEMCGLGVLVRMMEGKYRLRSPNLVRLMGTEEDILMQLMELGDRSASVEYDRNSLRACLDEAQGAYSPLTYAQEDMLNPPHPMVGFIFGSEASGVTQIPSALHRFVADLPPDVEAECLLIPARVRSEMQMRDWLAESVRERSRHGRLLFYQEVTEVTPELEGRIKAALSLCQGRLSSRRSLQILFVFHARSTWEWLNLPPDKRLLLEQRAHAVTFLQRWDLVGLRQRLAQSDKIDAIPVCERVMQVTGGWSWLLDQLFELCSTEDDPRPAAQTLHTYLQSSDTEIARELQRRLGLGTTTLPRRMFDELCMAGKTEPDVLLEWVAESASIGPQEGTLALEYLRRMACITNLDNNVIQADSIASQVIKQP